MEKEEKKVNGTPIEDEKLEEVAGGMRPIASFSDNNSRMDATIDFDAQGLLNSSTNMRVQSYDGKGFL